MTSLATGVDDEEAEAQLFGTSGGAVSAGERSRAGSCRGELLGVVGRTVGLDAIRLEQQARASRHLRRSDADLGRRRSRGAADAGQAAGIGRGTGLLPEPGRRRASRGSRATSVPSVCPGDCSCSTIRAGPTSSGTSRHSMAHGRASAPGRRRRVSAPSGSRARLVFPRVTFGRQLRLTEGDRFTFGGLAARSRSARAVLSRRRGLLRGAHPRPSPVSARGRLRPRRRRSKSARRTPGRCSNTRSRAGPATQLIVRGTDASGRRARPASSTGGRGRCSTVSSNGTRARSCAITSSARATCRRASHRRHRPGHFAGAQDADDRGCARQRSMPRRVEVTGNSALPTDPAAGSRAMPRTRSRRGSTRHLWSELLENHYRAEGFLAADVSLEQS